MLGYRYTVEAEVIGGEKLGRTLGFPTANMALPTGGRLAHGIYAVRFRRADGTLHDGVASYRPPPDRRRTTARRCSKPSSSIFRGDLYGEICSVSFFGYLRAEVKFDGLDPLVAQMKRDRCEARALLAGGTAALSDARSACIAFRRREVLAKTGFATRLVAQCSCLPQL